MKTNVPLTLIVGTALAWSAIPVSAAMETFTGTFGSAANPLALAETGFLCQLPLQKFDTSQGVLADIIISLTSVGSAQTDVLNLGAKAALFENARTSATITIAGDGVLAAVSLKTKPFSGTTAPGALDSGPGVSKTAAAKAHIAPADFSAYESDGGGTLDYVLNAAVVGTSKVTSSPKVYSTYNAATYGMVEIDYYYTPYAVAPEPGTLLTGLSALSVCGFVLARKARTPA